MPNSFNYAEKWQTDLLGIITDETLTSPFIVSNVNWLSAKTFHFTQKSVSGFKNHARSGGWNSGTITDTDKPYTVAHDRDIQFLVDKADVDETNTTASIQNTSNVFVRTQQAPETDAHFYERVAQAALANAKVENVALSTWSADNVVSRLKALFKNCKKYKSQAGGLIAYLKTEIMDYLSVAKEFTRNITVQNVGVNGTSVQTRITDLDGVTLIEILDDDRFYSQFDYSDGFDAADIAQAINVLVASPLQVKTVPKISSIYYFNAGTHTEGDGDLYQHRAFWDTFVFPNGKDGEIDCIYVSLEPNALFTTTITSAYGGGANKSTITITSTQLDASTAYGTTYWYKAHATEVAAPTVYSDATTAGYTKMTLTEAAQTFTFAAETKIRVAEVDAYGRIIGVSAETTIVKTGT